MKPCLLLLCFCLFVLAQKDGRPWLQLFNERYLSGWTPKISGYAAGENFTNTFRGSGGYFSVAYDSYENFANQFGHLFCKDQFSYYIIAVEYRFVGNQAKDGPGWAKVRRRQAISAHPELT